MTIGAKKVEKFAFPDADGYEAGMSLRDYFAGNALCAFEVSVENDMQMGFFYEPWVIAKRCYEIADAMLKAREAQ